jgi:hypothetical protein
MLYQDQLLVERDAVSKINKVNHAIPQNTVIAEVTNQVTGEESTRTLHWDQQLTTEEPLEVAIGETGKITVELALQRDEEAGRSTATRSPISQLDRSRGRGPTPGRAIACGQLPQGPLEHR